MILCLGFLILGITIGYKLREIIETKTLQTLKESINDQINDILGDLARYAIIAGESYEQTKRKIYNYRTDLEKLITRQNTTKKHQ